MSARPHDAAERRRVGLCVDCRFRGVQRNRRGGSFWRCRRADTDSHFARYPPLPVERCQGFEPDAPDRGRER